MGISVSSLIKMIFIHTCVLYFAISVWTSLLCFLQKGYCHLLFPFVQTGIIVYNVCYDYFPHSLNLHDIMDFYGNVSIDSIV